MTGECKTCGKIADLRLDHCWNCVEAESILSEGTDMRDNGVSIDGEQRPARTAMEKLRFLIQKGWHK